jgi:orotate phosphoribosyltransferase
VPATSEDQLLELFRKQEALLEGHFVLSSGLHSNRYFQSALLLQHPVVAAELGRHLASFFKNAADVVVSPAIGGLIIGHEVARGLGVRSIFIEKDENGKPVLRRNFNLVPGERTLVVEDVITTGLSTGEVLELVEKIGAKPIGVASIVNRSGAKNEKLTRWTIPMKSLLTLDVESWDPQSCALCAKGIPAIKPGSSKK